MSSVKISTSFPAYSLPSLEVCMTEQEHKCAMKSFEEKRIFVKRLLDSCKSMKLRDRKEAIQWGIVIDHWLPGR